jgi:hypothetical protein
MNSFIKENRQLISIILGWIFLHLVLYIYASEKHTSYSLLSDFYPFTEGSISQTYNIMEFLIYGIAPCLAGIILRLNSKSK